MLRKIGPLKDLKQDWGIILVQISESQFIDEWEIELELQKLEFEPVEIEDYNEFCVEQLALGEAIEIEFGVLDEEQMVRSTRMFLDLDAEFGALQIWVLIKTPFYVLIVILLLK